MSASVGQMIMKIAGLAGTADVDERTSTFITAMVERTANGTRTSRLTERQVEWIEDIHRKHFG